jgi:hypothetical protein
VQVAEVALDDTDCARRGGVIDPPQRQVDPGAEDLDALLAQARRFIAAGKQP